MCADRGDDPAGLLFGGDKHSRGAKANPPSAAPADLADPEPWPVPVKGAEVVEALERFFTRYLVLPTDAAIILALWTTGTWLFDTFDAFPYLAVTSPQKQCGKSRVLELLQLVCRRPLSTANISEAALFRVIEQESPTLFIDEAQNLRTRDERSSALHDLLCAGMRRGNAAIRMAGPHHDQVKRFSVFCPKVIALIGKMTDVLMDRAIEIPMRRRKRGERVDRFFFARASADTDPLRQQLARWAADHQDEVREAYINAPLPDWLEDRQAELWVPLLAVAHAAIPARITVIENIAKVMSGAKAEADDSIGVRLLADLRAIFDGQDFLPTKEIIGTLTTIEDAPWSEYRAGKPITAKGLADLLKPFEIEPGQARYNGQAGVRGYARVAFQDAWDRYLPLTSPADPLNVLQALQDKDENAVVHPLQGRPVADGDSSGTASRTRPVARMADEGAREADPRGVPPEDDGRRQFIQVMGEMLGWPALDIDRGEAIVADEAAWHRFCATASEDQIARTVLALMAMPETRT